MSSKGRKILIFFILLSLLIGFGAGIWFAKGDKAEVIPLIGKLINQDSGQPEDVDFALFWEVWTKLHEKYVDPDKLNQKEMLYGAIEGMVSSVGDPYTVFFEPQISQKFQEEINGSFGGVGIEIGIRNDIITVIAPLKDTPAYRAGMLAGDRVISVDSKSTADLTVEEVVELIRGKKGTEVILTISRNDEPNTRDFKITRDTIKIPSIEWTLLDNNVAYMQLYTFNQNIDNDFKNAASEILKSGASKLIIDLRNNPGGLLDSAINLAGWFMDKNSIVTMEEFRDGSREEFRSDGNGSLKIYPTIILLNGGSASASEILAGALRDNRGIKIVGDKSFGKGSVQSLEHFKNGSSLKVTIAKWLTPSGHSITDLGIEPDYKVEIPKDAEDGTLEFGIVGKDPQLDKAIELLR